MQVSFGSVAHALARQWVRCHKQQSYCMQNVEEKQDEVFRSPILAETVQDKGENQPPLPLGKGAVLYPYIC